MLVERSISLNTLLPLDQSTLALLHSEKADNQKQGLGYFAALLNDCLLVVKLCQSQVLAHTVTEQL